MTIENQRTQLERQRMQNEREIADKQLQIAQENKNKYDFKSDKEK